MFRLYEALEKIMKFDMNYLSLRNTLLFQNLPVFQGLKGSPTLLNICRSLREGSRDVERHQVIKIFLLTLTQDWELRVKMRSTSLLPFLLCFFSPRIIMVISAPDIYVEFYGLKSSHACLMSFDL